MHLNQQSKIALFSADQGEQRRALAQRLEEVGFEVLDLQRSSATRPPCRLALLLGDPGRSEAIAVAVDLAQNPRPPAVVLVVHDLTFGEYDELVNHGPVQYIFDASESIDSIVGGALHAAIRME